MMQKVLYLGTDPENFQHIDGLVHYPIIQTVPLEIPSHLLDDFSDYTHILFTSKNAVTIFFQTFKSSLENKKIVAIGKGTAAKLKQGGYPPHLVASQESQEGLMDLLRTQDLSEAYIFYPRSSLARKNLENFMIQRGIRHQICHLYTTVFQKPEPFPDLTQFDEIIFTSPSTVKAFLAAFGSLPLDKKLTSMGSITEEELKAYAEKKSVNLRINGEINSIER
jgi:uroporphyrinogen-III synthase